MNDDTRQRVMRLLGLGLRSRGAVVGVEQVRAAVRKGTVGFVAIAPDVSQNSLNKLVPLLEARRVSFTQELSSDELGALAGRQMTAAIGVTDAQLAKGIRELVWPRRSGPAGANQAQ